MSRTEQSPADSNVAPIHRIGRDDAGGHRRRSSIDAPALLRGGVAFAVAMGVLCANGDAAAQDQVWLKDRRYTEGPGIRVGNLELHPGVAAEVGYDSNFLRRSDDAGPAGSIRIRVTPSLSVSTLGPQRTQGAPNAPPPDVEFRGTVALTYNEFFGVNGPAVYQDVLNRQRNLSGNLDMNVVIAPRREWSGSIFAGLGRAVQPSEQGAFDMFQGAFDRLLPHAGAELVFAPGAGLLDWRLGYRFSGTIFERELSPPAGASFVSGYTNFAHTIQMRGRWRFLPRTAMIYDARFGFIDYPSSGQGPGDKTSSHPLRTRIGVSGLITPSLGALVMGGWGASFYEPRLQANDFDSFIGHAELKYYITPNPSADPSNASLALSSVSLGFIRDFTDSLIGTYLERNRAYANVTYFFGGKFLVVLDGGVGPVVYPALPFQNGVAQNDPDVVSGWTDIRWDASLFGEYRLKDYFGINALFRYTGNASPATLQTSGGADSLGWQSFEAYLGARFMM